MEFVKVASASEIEPNCAKRVYIKNKQIAVFNLAGEFYATDDICTHSYASLCEGLIENGEVECPLHRARFDIKTGEVTSPPALEALCTYQVRLIGDDIEVQLS